MISIQPAGAALGAFISGTDLAAEMDEQTFRQIVDALHEHEVIARAPLAIRNFGCAGQPHKTPRAKQVRM